MYIRVLGILGALAIGFSLPCGAAGEDAPSAALVSSHVYDDHTRLEFSWDAEGKVPFSVKTHGKQVELHFAKPVALEWDNTLDVLHGYVKQVEAKENGRVVVLTMSRPSQARRFLSYGRQGMDLSKSGIELSDLKLKNTTLPMATLSALPPPRKKTAHMARANKPAVKEKKVAAAEAPPVKTPPPPVQESKAAEPEAMDLAKLSPAAGKSQAGAAITLAQAKPQVLPVTAPPATDKPKTPVAGATPAATAGKAAADKEAKANVPITLFPYAQWKVDNEKNLVATELKLFQEITSDKPDAAEKVRLKLLGLFLSEGLFAEARGMADDILRVSYKFFRDNNVAAMRGAAHFFMYHFADAERDFSSPELAGNPEAKMWLTLCRELLGEGTETFNFVANYDRTIRYYPPAFIQKLAIIAADRDINRKEYDVASSIFDILVKDNLDEPVKKYIEYMRAKIFSETKNEEEAFKIWEQQSKIVDDPLIRARAEFSLVNMLLRQDKITHEDAIKRLEKLRIVWRGDSLELGVLTLLGDLYAEDKQYTHALHTMRDIVLYYPEVPEAVITAKKMEEIFVSLYTRGIADSLPPLEALSLFYEFRDLVPIGQDGDEMIRKLADRLVKIDLLDRAALLLDHQIRKRLQGAERSRVGAQLALIYLMNHQPKDALETLKTTGFGDLPGDLKLTRLRLTAQALAQQGQVDKAIDVLGSDTSADGSLLRLSIYWDNKDWPNVVATAEELLGNRNDPSAPLTAQESDVLLKLATAYVYEHDTGQIQYLRDYFTPLLKNNPNKDSFLFVTSESGAIDYSNLSNLDQDISSVKSFLDRYRDKVKKNGLSKTL